MPIEMAPATSSAMPPRMTSLDSPSEERPAVSAKGTVRPSERPMTLCVGPCEWSETVGVEGKGRKCVGCTWMHRTCSLEDVREVAVVPGSRQELVLRRGE